MTIKLVSEQSGRSSRRTAVSRGGIGSLGQTDGLLAADRMRDRQARRGGTLAYEWLKTELAMNLNRP